MSDAQIQILHRLSEVEKQIEVASCLVEVGIEFNGDGISSSSSSSTVRNDSDVLLHKILGPLLLARTELRELRNLMFPDLDRFPSSFPRSQTVSISKLPLPPPKRESSTSSQVSVLINTGPLEEPIISPPGSPPAIHDFPGEIDLDVDFYHQDSAPSPRPWECEPGDSRVYVSSSSSSLSCSSSASDSSSSIGSLGLPAIISPSIPSSYQAIDRFFEVHVASSFVSTSSPSSSCSHALFSTTSS